jgi:3-oxoacyl-[acyl-carrier protein] reductase
MGDLTGMCGLVTGGSRGLGAVVARRLAAAGADVAVHYHQDAAGAAATAAAVRELGRTALVVQADTRDPQAVAELVNRTASELGGLDLVVNNAGVAPVRPWTSITAAEWAETLETNLSGPFHVLRAALPHLQQAPGRAAVVNVGSVVSMNGGSFGPAYAAAKAGLEGLTRSAARDLGPLGIRVNCVAPGPLESPLVEALPEALLAAMAAQTPLRRLGSFEEAAAAIVWLLSPAASYINGQTLVVDGGRLMR